MVVMKIFLLHAVFMIADLNVNGIELYKMNLHKAISKNMKDATDDNEDDDDIGMVSEKPMETLELDSKDVLAYSGQISG